MALKKLTLRPGINKEGTSYSNEDGFYNSDKIRFRSGYAEKIGGWQNIGTYTYVGVARSLWSWVSLTSETLTGVGTSQKFYIESSTQYHDITPIRTINTLDSPYFTVSSGNQSVRVDDVAHNATPGTYVTFTSAHTTLTSSIPIGVISSIDVGSTTGFASPTGSIQINGEVISYTGTTATSFTGITRAQSGTIATPHNAGVYVISAAAITVGGINLQGSFEIISIAPDYYNILYPTLPGSSGSAAAGTYYAIYDINASKGAAIKTYGWGAGGWGVLAWGSNQAVSTATPLRLWSQTNYDQDLIFAPRDGGIYWWTKDTQSYPVATTINTYANTQIKTAANITGTWLSGASSITVNDITGINFGAVVTGAGIPAGAYISPDWDQSTTIPLITKQNTPAVTTAAGTNTPVSFSYSGNHIPSRTLLITTSSQNAFTIAFGASSYNPRIYEVPAVFIGGNGSAANSTALTISSTISGSIYPGMEISGVGIVPGTTLVSGSGTSWVMSAPMTIPSGTTITATALFDPLLVRWSDQDKPWEWVPEITNQSGEQRLSNGSVIIAATNTRQEILVWTDTAIYSMQYLGPPYVYSLNLLMDNLSIASQNAAITVNNVTYWMGTDRFYSYSGRVETLPCTLRQFVYSDINKSQLGLIVSGSNEGFNEVWWFYPSAGSPCNNRYVIYNHLENLWYYGTINRTTWLDTQLKQYPLGAFSTERTTLPEAIANATTTTIKLEDTSTLPSAGVVTIQNENVSYTTVDYTTNTISGGARGVNGTLATTHPINSPVVFTTSNQIMFHEYGYDDASGATAVPIESYIESSDFDIEDGLNFSYVWRIIPDLSFSGSTTSSPKCYLTVKVRQNSGSAYSIDPSDPINDPYDAQPVYRTATSPVEQYTGQVYVRVRGRQMAFRMSSTDLGVFWQMGMMRIDVRQDGRR